MAFSHGSNAKFYLNGFDASPYYQSVSQDAKIDSAETSALGTTAKTYIPGLMESTIKMDGMWDRDLSDDTLSFSFKVDSLVRTITEATYFPTGDVFGSRLNLTQGIITDSSIDTSVKDVAGVKTSMQSSVGLADGLNYRALAASGTSAAVSGTSIDNLASSANGIYAVMHVTNVSGTGGPTLACKIQHSTTNSAFVDLVSFTNKTAKGSELVSTSGTVNRWLVINYTITGTSPSFTFQVGIARR